MSLWLIILWPILGAFAVYLLPDRLAGKRGTVIRDTFVWITAATEVLLCGFLLTDGYPVYLRGFSGLGIGLNFSSFHAAYCFIAALSWLILSLLSREYTGYIKNGERFYFYLLLTESAVMGIFMASDFFTLFLFFELLSLVSFPLVLHHQTPEAKRAAASYLAVSVIGGMCILMGLFILYRQIGSLVYSTVFTFAPYMETKMLLAAGFCMLVGFGAKAGMYGLHIWLAKSLTAAPAPAAAAFSGILSKTGVYGIIVISVNMLAKNEIWGKFLLWAGIATMLWGGICALGGGDLKRILAYSCMSQIGFILSGIGAFVIEGSAASAAGVIMHMISHSFITLLLFLTTGVIEINAKTTKLSELRGFGHDKLFLGGVFLSGALGVADIPFWNGYIGKTLLHESIKRAGGPVAEVLFLLTGGFTIAYITKVFYVIFLEKPPYPYSTQRTGAYISSYSMLGLLAGAILLPLIGLFPNSIAAAIIDFSAKTFRSGNIESIYYYSGEMLTGAFLSLMAGVFLYAIFAYRKDGTKISPDTCDLEYLFYRPLIFGVLLKSVGAICTVLDQYIFEPAVSGIVSMAKKHNTERASRAFRMLARVFSAVLLLICIGIGIAMICSIFS